MASFSPGEQLRVIPAGMPHELTERDLVQVEGLDVLIGDPLSHRATGALAVSMAEVFLQQKVKSLRGLLGILRFGHAQRVHAAGPGPVRIYGASLVADERADLAVVAHLEKDGGNFLFLRLHDKRVLIEELRGVDSEPALQLQHVVRRQQNGNALTAFCEAVHVFTALEGEAVVQSQDGDYFRRSLFRGIRCQA